MPSGSAASVLVSTLVLLLLASTTAAVGDGDAAASSGNVTAIVTGGNNSSATVPADSNDSGMYICYVCTGRNVMMMKWCPTYWDECHLNCGASSSATTSAVPPSVLGVGDAGDGNNECYVMKLYNDGRYTIVAILECAQVGRCSLTCGGGEHLGAGNALPAAAARVPAAASQRPRVADFQRCGDQAAMAWARGAVQRGA